MGGSIVAIILSAGYSSRMGAFKPLMAFGQMTVIERAIAMFRDAGIADVRVVVGHRAAELLPALASLHAAPLINEHYEQDMFSSVVAAVTSLGAECDAFFLLPVDVPLVKRETVDLLARSFGTADKGILYPTHRGERGHPPLISRAYRDRILAWTGANGLMGLLGQYEDDSVNIECGDPGILLDMDTPEEYERLLGVLNETAIPTPQACERLLDERFGSESRVAEHSRAVARLARALATRLNDHGCRLDLGVIEAAALLHDVAKGEPGHAAAGAALVREMGYGTVADIIASHHDSRHHADDDVDAADVVFLADKLVQGTRFVTLEDRFHERLQRHANDGEVLAKVTERLEGARSVLRRVESLTGLPVDESWMETA